MRHRNRIEFELSGRLAMFTDPLTKAGGERLSLPVPTYEALKGAVGGIYLSHAIEWVIDSVRVMNKIATEPLTVTRRRYRHAESEIAVYTYLTDVRYRVRAHFVWSKSSKQDERTEANENKYYQMTVRSIGRGGRRTVYLGTHECVAEINEAEFTADRGYYDGSGKEDFGLMHHSFIYGETLTETMWDCVMENGVISFPKPCDCPVSRAVRRISED